MAAVAVLFECAAAQWWGSTWGTTSGWSYPTYGTSYNPYGYYTWGGYAYGPTVSVVSSASVATTVSTTSYWSSAVSTYAAVPSWRVYYYGIYAGSAVIKIRFVGNYTGSIDSTGAPVAPEGEAPIGEVTKGFVTKLQADIASATPSSFVTDNGIVSVQLDNPENSAAHTPTAASLPAGRGGLPVWVWACIGIAAAGASVAVAAGVAAAVRRRIVVGRRRRMGFEALADQCSAAHGEAR